MASKGFNRLSILSNDRLRRKRERDNKKSHLTIYIVDNNDGDKNEASIFFSLLACNGNYFKEISFFLSQCHHHILIFAFTRSLLSTLTIFFVSFFPLSGISFCALNFMWQWISNRANDGSNYFISFFIFFFLFLFFCNAKHKIK